MLAELRVAICKKLVAAVSHDNSVLHGTLDSGEQLVACVVAKVHDCTFVRLITELDAEEAIFMLAELADDSV